MLTIGVVTPHAAAGPGAEWSAILTGLVTRTARIAGDGPAGAPPSSPAGLRASADPARGDGAVAALRPGSLDALGFASTSTGYALGHEAETALVVRLESRWRLPAQSTSAAALLALRALGVERLALLHPPWFGDALHRLGVEYFTGQGFDVTGSIVTDLPDDPDRVVAADVMAAVPVHVPDSAQAVFLGGNGFRTTAAIAGLESVLGRPVLAANQVLLWSLLDKAGQHLPITGYGSLFRPDPAG